MLRDPIFILAAPRSGSSFLFETLARSPDLFTVGGDSHHIIEATEALRIEENNYDSNRLGAGHATDEVISQLRGHLFSQLRDCNGTAATTQGRPIRMLEKTPKNALRVPFLRKLFPNALFIYLYREPKQNISSIIDAWRSGEFVTYPDLPGWTGPPWSMLLIPGWRDLDPKDIPAIAAAQWESTHRIMLDDLVGVPHDRICGVLYEDLVADPKKEILRLCKFADISWNDELDQALPLSLHTLIPEDPDNWKNNTAELERVLPAVTAIAGKARHFVGEHYTPPTKRAPVAMDNIPVATAPTDLRSVHTTSCVPILEQLGISLLVSTYQAGKLIVVRADNGKVNTHFRVFQKPMGMSMGGNKLALGTANEIQILANMPDVAHKLEPIGKHDACFIYRDLHVTGDIDIHEMAWSGDNELWFINTRFSCLCTMDQDHSFVPRWRPPFITGLAPEDRCHLNGLCMVNGKPKYVTALGQSDKHQGWRENKARGGILMDIESNRIICQGLSMPHSPRVYAGQLWVLESGKGSLSTVDIKTGRTNTVATLPGFTRGLDFVGQFAFVGLSQVRETAVFSGIPITEQKDQRNCGVWIVDITNGQVIGFLRFEGSVEEVFSVQILHGMRFPEILEPGNKLIGTSYILPDEALRDVPTSIGQTHTPQSIQ